MRRLTEEDIYYYAMLYFKERIKFGHEITITDSELKDIGEKIMVSNLEKATELKQIMREKGFIRKEE